MHDTCVFRRFRLVDVPCLALALQRDLADAFSRDRRFVRKLPEIATKLGKHVLQWNATSAVGTKRGEREISCAIISQPDLRFLTMSALSAV